jgi:hypothetical protein
MLLDHYTVLHFGMCHAAAINKWAQLVQSMAAATAALQLSAVGPGRYQH